MVRARQERKQRLQLLFRTCGIGMLGRDPSNSACRSMKTIDTLTPALGRPQAIREITSGTCLIGAVGRWRHQGACVNLSEIDRVCCTLWVWRLRRGRRCAFNVSAAPLEPGVATAREVPQRPNHADGHFRRLVVSVYPLCLWAAYTSHVLARGGGRGDVLGNHGARAVVPRYRLV